MTDRRIKAADKELKALVIASGSRLMDLPGIGPIGAARIIADVGDIARFSDRNRFASWTGTAPLDASSGEQVRHRLSRAGNRKINHMLHMAALSQIRLDTDGRAYYRRKRAAGKTHLEACGASSDESLTPSIANSSTTTQRLLARVREGNAGRLKYPARPTYPRASALRISHSRTRAHDATPRLHGRESPNSEKDFATPVDNRGEPERRGSAERPRLTVGDGGYVDGVTEIDVSFCFYDDPDFETDADRDSRLLKAWHRRLWSKPLPSGEKVVWDVEPSGALAFQRPRGVVRVSSDTIATSHSRYARLGMPQLWAHISDPEQERYERAFYTIGGFIIFPIRPQSLNQSRGTRLNIADRFDLTLECIRQHYVGERGNPLADVLEIDADYFGLFGEGLHGFTAFIDFFHLQDLVGDGSIRWLDGSGGDRWDFGAPTLPRDLTAYRGYLDKVAEFVALRNVRIARWVQAHPPATADQVL